MADEPDRDIPKSDASSIRDGSQWPRHHHRARNRRRAQLKRKQHR